MKKSFTRWHKINSSFEADRIHAGAGLAKMKLKLQARGSYSRFVVIPRNERSNRLFRPLEIMDIEDPQGTQSLTLDIGDIRPSTCAQ